MTLGDTNSGFACYLKGPFYQQEQVPSSTINTITTSTSAAAITNTLATSSSGKITPNKLAPY